jgi:hypothetical protein
MGRPTLTAKARGRSGCRGPFPGGDEASVVACFPSRGCAAWRGEPEYETATPDLNT